MASIYLDIDTSDVDELIRRARAAFTTEQFERLMYRAFKRTGSHAKTIIKREVAKDYVVTQRWVGSQIGAPKMGQADGLGTVGCTIPIHGVRGIIGDIFPGSGPRGRKPGKHRKYRITARIVRGMGTVLPAVMSHQGGQPPFIAPNSRLVMTRTTKNAYPIARVPGLAVPQMPMNRSRDSIQDEIIATLGKRIEHEWRVLVGGIR